MNNIKSNYKVIGKVTDIDLANIRGLLLDIDDTLYSYKDAHLHALKVCYGELSSVTPSFTSFENFATIYTEKRSKVKCRLEPQGACRSRLFAFQDLFEEIGIHQAYSLALTYEDIYWKSLIKHIVLRDHFMPFLLACKKLNIAICAISDMQAHFQILKIKKLGLDSVIDFIVTSEEVGIEKPHASIFNFALKKLNLKANEVIMIGDSLEKDIEGAEKLGINAYLLEP